MEVSIGSFRFTITNSDLLAWTGNSTFCRWVDIYLTHWKAGRAMTGLSPDQAQALWSAGGFVILTDLPEGSEFGIDGT